MGFSSIIIQKFKAAVSLFGGKKQKQKTFRVIFDKAGRSESKQQY